MLGCIDSDVVEQDGDDDNDDDDECSEQADEDVEEDDEAGNDRNVVELLEFELA